MVIRFRYALHVETDLIHVWPSKAARTHDRNWRRKPRLLRLG